MKTVLVCQSFGRESEYRRAVLAILSAFCFLSEEEKKAVTVVLFTDQPNWFQQWLSGIQVDYRLMTPEKMQQMRGEINFLHRMKIALIEETFYAYPKHVMFYIDSDTFFQGSCMPIAVQVSHEKAFMHLIEYPFHTLNNPLYSSTDPFYKFYHLIVNQPIALNDTETVIIQDTLFSYNAGVMCFHPSHVALIPAVYALTTAIYVPTENHASEQYAFSIVLQHKKQLQTIGDTVFHYWHRVQKQVVDERLEKAAFLKLEHLSHTEKLEAVKGLIDVLPAYILRHTYVLLDQVIQELNQDEFKNAYRNFARLLFRSPFLALKNVRHVLYHSKRYLIQK